MTPCEWYRTVYLDTEHWKQLRLKKLRKVSACEVCGIKKHLDVHHKVYNLYHEKLSKLSVLCRKHHNQEHQNNPKRQKKKSRAEFQPQLVQVISVPVKFRFLQALLMKLSPYLSGQKKIRNFKKGTRRHGYTSAREDKHVKL